MSTNAKLVVAVAAACAYLLAVLLACGFVLGSGLAGSEQAALAALLERRVGAVLMIAFAACAFLFVILRPVHEFLVVVLARAAEEANALLDDPARRLSLQGSRELQGLLAAVNRLAEQRQAHEVDVEARIRAANAAADADRNRFAALIAELAQGVVVCNPDGRILLYNRRARDLFPPAAMGLARSIYAVFDRQLIAYALENVAEPGAANRHFVAVAGESGRLLRVDVAPVPEGGVAAAPAPPAGRPPLSGYLLMLDDITETFESESRRDALLEDLTEKSRGPLGNLRAAAETLHDYPDMRPEEREQFLAVVRHEAQVLGERVETAAREFAAVVKARWPLEEMLGSDLLAAARRRIEARCQLPVSIEAAAADLWLKVDGFSLLQALTYLAARLRDEYAIRELKLRLTGEPDMAYIDLIWSGVFMSTETVMNWELDPMSLAGETSPLSVRDVIGRCGGEMWFQREHGVHRAYFRFLLPAAAEGRGKAPSLATTAIDSRPEFYDFDLFKGVDSAGDLDDRLLAQLDFTVFDTETTGLEPSAGDEIIQIGAVRIVNRRLLRHETFEQLIDPRRPLPAKSVKIHGITPAMLAGQPGVERVLPMFRAFVADTVLVAHNAAFDLRFLELKEAATGVRFDRPVLDTFLLSAVLFPHQESHRLEAIAERLGVSVIGRHTAVGDAIVTGEVFLKMIGLLAERGIRTLREARAAAEKTYHARISY